MPSVHARAVSEEVTEQRWLLEDRYRDFVERYLLSLPSDKSREILNLFESYFYRFELLYEEIDGSREFGDHPSMNDACFSDDISENVSTQLRCVANFVVYASDIVSLGLPVSCWVESGDFGQNYQLASIEISEYSSSQSCHELIDDLAQYRHVYAYNLSPLELGHPAIFVREVEGNSAFSVEYISYRPLPPPAPPPSQVFNAALGDLYNRIALALRDGSRRNYVLTQDLLYCRESTSEIIIIPAGFITDLLSVPDAARILDNERTYTGAVIHDWLFALGGDESDRIVAEEIFREELRFNRAGALRTFALSFSTEHLGPLYYNLVGRSSPFGRAEEMRFATPDSCRRAGDMRSHREPVFIYTERGCNNFQDNYDEYHDAYASDNTIDLDSIVDNEELRQYFMGVISNTDESRTCSDFIR